MLRQLVAVLPMLTDRGSRKRVAVHHACILAASQLGMQEAGACYVTGSIMLRALGSHADRQGSMPDAPLPFVCAVLLDDQHAPDTYMPDRCMLDPCHITIMIGARQCHTRRMEAPEQSHSEASQDLGLRTPCCCWAAPGGWYSTRSMVPCCCILLPVVLAGPATVGGSQTVCPPSVCCASGGAAYTLGPAALLPIMRAAARFMGSVLRENVPAGCVLLGPLSLPTAVPWCARRMQVATTQNRRKMPPVTEPMMMGVRKNASCSALRSL